MSSSLIKSGICITDYLESLDQRGEDDDGKGVDMGGKGDDYDKSQRSDNSVQSQAVDGRGAEEQAMVSKWEKLKEIHDLEEDLIRMKESCLQRKKKIMELEGRMVKCKQPFGKKVLDKLEGSVKSEKRDGALGKKETPLSGASKVQEWLEDKHSEHPEGATAVDNNLMGTLVSYNLRSLMPKIEIAKFGGEATEYKSFIKSFDSLIGNNLPNDEEKLYYLEQYTFGKPREIIKGCLHMDAGDGYKEARHLLDKRYGNPEKIASAYVSKILEWHAIAQDDVEGLDEFALALRTCRNAISTVPYEAREMEHPKTLLKIVEKLPYHIQDRWRRRADSIYEDEGRLVVFEDLVNLVEKEARIALNPNFGRHLMNSKSKLDENKERGWRASKNDRLKCNFVKEFSCWKCGESHFLDKCAEFLSMPYNDREEFLRKECALDA